MTRVSIVVSVGTDHHPFDRLVDWVERWMTESAVEVDLFVQHGSSRAPRRGEGVDMMSHDEMLDRYRAADIVITQVGPGSILDAASAGKLPIVVPRRPDLGEHVDGHQIVFGRFMSQRHEALLAEDEAEFGALLTRAASNPALVAQAPRVSPAPDTVRTFGDVIDEVMRQPVGFIRWSRIRAVGSHRTHVGAPLPAPRPTSVPILVPVLQDDLELTQPIPVTTITPTARPRSA